MSVPKISLSLNGGRKLPAPANGVKRSRSAFQDDGEEDEQEGNPELVSHFDKKSGGAIPLAGRKPAPADLVIPKLANRDWKEAANKRKRQKSGIPAHEVNRQTEEALEAAEAAKRPQFGLNVTRPEHASQETQVNGGTRQANEALADAEKHQERAPSPNGDGIIQQKTDDEQAMDALLGRNTVDTTLRITQPAMSESDAFRHDYDEAPDMASLESYANMPVEQFGAAMLRGMGWKDGEGIGAQRGVKLPKTATKLPQRRANLLGIGAKEDAALAGEMGVWGKAARSGKGEVKIYNPVLLKDKQTGELFTEEELKQKQEREERRKFELEFEQKEKERERKRRKEEEYDSKGRRRQRDDDRTHERRREKDHDRRRRDEDSDKEDYRSRKDKERRARDEEGDEEYYRRKEKERRKREREHRDDEVDGRRRDKHRSERHRERR